MLVLLDRDGVINQDRAEGVLSLATLVLLPGAVQAIARLCQNGAAVAVATNQSAVGRGLLKAETLEAIHQHIAHEVEKAGGKIARFYYAPDTPDAPTPRRKPGPGMLQEALRDFGAHAVRTPMVGDALRDLQAAKAAGCPRYLVRSGQGKATLASGLHAAYPAAICRDLPEAAERIIHDFGLSHS